MRQSVVIRIRGRVQGVFFRDSATRKAKKFGIQGIARNECDGSVIIEVEGEEHALQQFIAWCRRGPPFARVDAVETVSHNNLHRFADFVIE